MLLWLFLIIIIAYYTPKPCSNFCGPDIRVFGCVCVSVCVCVFVILCVCVCVCVLVFELQVQDASKVLGLKV